MKKWSRLTCLPLFIAILSTARGDDFIRSVDVMKYSKDVVTHQPDDRRIDNLVTILKTLNIDYIAISVPLDPDSDYPAQDKPAPRSARAFTQKWADIIHAHGLHVLWRGTWSGLEGLNYFPRQVGANRLSASVWLEKTRQYITENPSFFRDGDIWAPLPERTENIFQDSTSFLPHDGGIQKNYAAFFADLQRISAAAFSQINKQVNCGFSANNYTEVKSGWLPQSLFDNAGVIVIDYYGNNHSPEEMDRDIRQMYARYGKPVFIQEWSDFWHSQDSPSERSAYLRQIYAVLQKLSEEKILIGFNYWGGWDNTTESLVTEDHDGFHLNYRGYLLQEFFNRNDKGAAK